MRVAVDGARLTQDWKTGIVSQGARPTVKVASSPRPRTVWNGNPFCDPGCVLYMPGHPGSGTKIYDFSGKGNTGTFGAGAAAPTWTRLPSGLWCLSFDGADYVTVGDVTTFKWLHGALDPTGFKFTIEGWIRLGKVGAAQALLGTCQFSSVEIGTIFGVGSSNQILVLIAMGTALVANIASAANVISADGKFHQIIVTYDQSLASSNGIIYLDAVNIKTGNKSAGAPSTANSTDALTIAHDHDTVRIQGSIALPRIYKDWVLSVQEIQNHFNQERHLFGV